MRRLATLALAVILAVAFMPAGFGALGADKAYAGVGGNPIANYVVGLNSDKATVDPGQTLKFPIYRLDDYLPGLAAEYEAGKVEISWSKADDDAYTNTKKATTYVEGGYICTDVKLADAGKWYRLYTNTKVDNTSFNSNSPDAFRVYDTLTIQSEPSLSTTYYRTQKTVGKNDYTFLLNAPTYFTLSFKEHTFYEYQKTLKLYRNGSLVKTVTTTTSQAEFKDIPVSYGKNDSFKVKIFLKVGSMEIERPDAITFTDTSKKLTSNKVYATKFSKNKVRVSWSGVQGAAGYYVYMYSGSKGKKIKTLGASKRSYVVSKKNAGKKKYKVIAYYKANKSKSNKATPKTNKRTWYHSKNPDSYSYGQGNFVVTKVQLKGKYYYVTGYAINNRIIYKLSKYKKLSFVLTVNGKVVMKKTYKNKKVNLGHGKVKKMTFKIKGKPNKDLVNSQTYISVGYSPVWKL